MRPTLVDSKASVWFISTPNGFNHFKTLYEAAGLDSSKSLSKGKYFALASAVTAVALGMGWSNAATQAVIWCAIRGGHT